MKIVSKIWFTRKDDGKMHSRQKTTVGGASELHAAKSAAGKALKYYASRVEVIADGTVVFKGSLKSGVTVNTPSSTFSK